MKEMTTKLEEEVSVAAKAAKREAAKLQQRVSKKETANKAMTHYNCILLGY